MLMKTLTRLIIDWKLIPRPALTGKYCWHSNGSNSRKYSSRTSNNIVRSLYPDITLPNVPLHRFVWESVNKWPNHTAIECGISGKKYSYSELLAKTKRFGSSLKKLGLKKGDIISIMLPNIPEFAIVYLGALEIGLIASTVNPTYTKDETLEQLKSGNAHWILCHPSNLPVVSQVRTLLPDLKVICTHNIDGTCPQVDDGVILLEDLITDSVDDSLPGEDDVPETALIAYSSGTTGLPKGTCLTHSNITANITQISAYKFGKLRETQGSHQDIVPAILPFFHCYGNSIILLNSLRKGCKIITLPKFDPKIYVNMLANNKDIVVYLVPPIVFFLGNCEEVTHKHLKGVREFISGAAPCSAYDIEKITRKTNGKALFSQGYGLTESSPGLTLYIPKGSDENTSTVGQLIPNTSAKVLSLDNGQTLPANQTGELCFQGPQIMKGYLNNAEATADVLKSDGWLHTGDVGYYDEDGYFYVTDRIKELIKVKGFQVAPAELEQVIRKIPGVLEAGVVGAPSQSTGETPVAFVQTAPNAKISEQDIKTFVASQLSKHKHISSVRFIPAIPKTASGKIIRRELKQLVKTASD